MHSAPGCSVSCSSQKAVRRPLYHSLISRCRSLTLAEHSLATSMNNAVSRSKKQLPGTLA